MSAPGLLKAHSLPHSESFFKEDIGSKILKRLPVAIIHELDPDWIGGTINKLFFNLKAHFQGNSFSIDDFETNIKNLLGDPGDKIENEYKSSGFEEGFKYLEMTGDNKNSLPISLKFLFRTFASSVINKYNLKIMTSPHISINTKSGWQDSISAIETVFSYGEAAAFGLNKSLVEHVSEGKISKLTKGYASAITKIINFMGYDVQFGPRFLLKDIDKDKPTFSFTTYLVNDHKNGAIDNKKIITNLFKESLPKAEGYFSFKPGRLYNLGIEIDVGKPKNDNSSGEVNVLPIKKLFLCKGTFTLTPLGIYRDGNTPEIYKLDLTFQSLLPDFMNLQMVDFEKQSKKGTVALEKNISDFSKSTPVSIEN